MVSPLSGATRREVTKFISCEFLSVCDCNTEDNSNEFNQVCNFVKRYFVIMSSVLHELDFIKN